jgi:hypothetical protein
MDRRFLKPYRAVIPFCCCITDIIRVSSELYREPAHFILELIQNADDNQYDTSVEPTLGFQLSGNELVIKCNEMGFMEENVRSICRVCASTKRRPGAITNESIGEKGIGIVPLVIFWLIRRFQVSIRCGKQSGHFFEWLQLPV